MAFNYPGAYSFYRPRPQSAGYACYPDAYESAGDSYANTLFAPPFTRRRPSPPPATFLPRNVSQNDYIRALAEEQAARSALSEAIQREQAARVRRERAEAEARRKALESEYKRRLRPQTVYGYPFGYHGYPQEYYDNEEEDDAQDSASPFDLLSIEAYLCTDTPPCSLTSAPPGSSPATEVAFADTRVSSCALTQCFF